VEIDMADQNGPRLIVEGMKEAGVSFVTSLPDANLQKLLALVDGDPELTHVTLREKKRVSAFAPAHTWAV
jgi:sulfopyruvate decarboxylase TPP-binding subunit